MPKRGQKRDNLTVLKTKTGSKRGQNLAPVRKSTSNQEVSPIYPKTDKRYWLPRLRKRTEGGTYQIRIKAEGKDIWFNTFSANQQKAARKAAEIFFAIKTKGVEEAREIYKKKPNEAAEINTVGPFIDSILELKTTIKKQTIDQYAGSFRQIAFEVNAIGSTRSRWNKKKFDYRGEGRDEWLSYVDNISLDSISADAVMAWRIEKKETTAASLIRQAKAFVAIIKGEGVARQNLRSKLPVQLPFEDVKTNAPKTRRHKTILGAGGETLAMLAMSELKEKYSEQYKAFLLCFYAGLRKEEADMLYWDQIDLTNGIIQIQEHQYFSPKSDEAERVVDLDPTVCSEIAKMKAKSTGIFVLKGAKPLILKRQYHGYYRARPVWRVLMAWLKKKGITVQKPIHYLRKESGSYMASAHGIEAARQHLGHADIAVTSAHYSDKKGRKAIAIPGIQIAERTKEEEAR